MLHYSIDWGRRVGSAGDNVLRAVGDVKEREVLDIVKGRPDEFGGLRDKDDRLEDAGSDVSRTWVIPSVVRALEDLKDGSGGIHNVLLRNVIKGGPGGNGEVREGGKGGGGRLRSVERHLILN